MLGVVLLYVGIVLINNGIARITDVDAKSASVMNVFTGLLSIVINIITIIHMKWVLYMTHFFIHPDFYKALNPQSHNCSHCKAKNK